jgi:Fur family zinc uptake transcriptional regulator
LTIPSAFVQSTTKGNKASGTSIIADGDHTRINEIIDTATTEKLDDLIASFGVEGQPAKPPTVYRALDFLEKQGFVHRIESLNAYVACHHGDRAHAAAFLICDCCGASAEIEPVAGQEITAIGERTGFLVQALTIEAHGLCKACRA